MKVSELMEYLSEFNEDAEVRLAIQPRWPFEHSAARVEAVNPRWEREKERWEEDRLDAELAEEPFAKPYPIPRDDDEVVVYIAEGEQIGYLPGAVAEALGWGGR